MQLKAMNKINGIVYAFQNTNSFYKLGQINLRTM